MYSHELLVNRMISRDGGRPMPSVEPVHPLVLRTRLIYSWSPMLCGASRRHGLEVDVKRTGRPRRARKTRFDCCGPEAPGRGPDAQGPHPAAEASKGPDQGPGDPCHPPGPHGTAGDPGPVGRRRGGGPEGYVRPGHARQNRVAGRVGRAAEGWGPDCRRADRKAKKTVGFTHRRGGRGGRGVECLCLGLLVLAAAARVLLGRLVGAPHGRAATWAPRHPSKDPCVARSGAKSTVSRALAARSSAAARSSFAAACMPSRWARSRFFSLRAALRASRSGAALLMNW